MLEVDGRSMAGVAQAAVLHDGRRGVSQRHVILMTAAGRCKDSIAADLGCSPSTVDNVRKRYRERGLAGLKRRKPPGPKPRATAEYRAALRQAVQTPPQTLGFGFSVWPAVRLAAYLERQMGVALTTDRVRRMTGDRERMGFMSDHDDLTQNSSPTTAKKQHNFLVVPA